MTKTVIAAANIIMMIEITIPAMSPGVESQKFKVMTICLHHFLYIAYLVTNQV